MQPELEEVMKVRARFSAPGIPQRYSCHRSVQISGQCSFCFWGCVASLPRLKTPLSSWVPGRLSRRPLQSAGTQEYGKRQPQYSVRYLPVAPAKGSSRFLMARAILPPAKPSLRIARKEARFDRIAGRAHRNRSHLQPSRCPPGASAFGGSVGGRFSLAMSRLECAADREVQP